LGSLGNTGSRQNGPTRSVCSAQSVTTTSSKLPAVTTRSSSFCRTAPRTSCGTRRGRAMLRGRATPSRRRRRRRTWRPSPSGVGGARCRCICARASTEVGTAEAVRRCRVGVPYFRGLEPTFAINQTLAPLVSGVLLGDQIGVPCFRGLKPIFPIDKIWCHVLGL